MWCTKHRGILVLLGVSYTYILRMKSFLGYVTLLFLFHLRFLTTNRSLHHVILLLKIQGVLLLMMDLGRIEEASISHLVWILCIPGVFWRTSVKQTSLYHVILLIKIQGVLLLMMDLWRIEEASISHLVCTLCIPKVFWRTFVKQTFPYHVSLLIKIQGVLLLRMDLWRTPGASLVSDKVWRSNTLIFDEL